MSVLALKKLHTIRINVRKHSNHITHILLNKWDGSHLLLLDEEAVRIATHLGPEYGQNQGEEESHQNQSDRSQNPSLCHSSLALGCLSKQYHAKHDGSVQHGDKVGLCHKLTLKRKL